MARCFSFVALPALVDAEPSASRSASSVSAEVSS